MSESTFTYKRLIDYLKGVLSNRQRHALEEEVMRDAFKEDAFEGSNLLSADELEADMELMESKLEDRIKIKKKRVLPPYFQIAASIVMLTGLAVVIYFALLTRTQELAPKEIAQEKAVERIVPVEQSADDAKKAVSTQQDIMKRQEPKSDILAQPMEEKEAAEVIIQDDKQGVYQPPVEAREKSIAEIHDAEVRESQAAGEKQGESVGNIQENKAYVLQEPEEMKNHSPAVVSEDDMAVRGRAVAVQSTLQHPKVFSARVVDQEGQPLPGVTIQEKGTYKGAITDVNGRFSLELDDTPSTFVLSFVGFETIEVPSNEISEKDIEMQEDVLALEEVVVVGYGVEKKSDVTGAVSVVNLDDPLVSSEPTIVFTSPVPPGGSIRAYRKLVEDKLEYERFRELSGKYKIYVTLLVQKDGWVKEIHIQNGVPDIISEEYKRRMAEIQPWQPATEGNIPVDAEVKIRFDLKVD